VQRDEKVEGKSIIHKMRLESLHMRYRKGGKTKKGGMPRFGMGSGLEQVSTITYGDIMEVEKNRPLHGVFQSQSSLGSVPAVTANDGSLHLLVQACLPADAHVLSDSGSDAVKVTLIDFSRRWGRQCLFAGGSHGRGIVDHDERLVGRSRLVRLLEVMFPRLTPVVGIPAWQCWHLRGRLGFFRDGLRARGVVSFSAWRVRSLGVVPASVVVPSSTQDRHVGVISHLSKTLHERFCALDRRFALLVSAAVRRVRGGSGFAGRRLRIHVGHG